MLEMQNNGTEYYHGGDTPMNHKAYIHKQKGAGSLKHSNQSN